jgi:hypothetical protein
MIYIFGGSYAVNENNPISWVTQLDQTYQVTNLAKANTSNSDMLLASMAVHKKLTRDDVVIVVWNDYMFPYTGSIRNLPLEKQEKLLADYFEYFYNDELAFEHYLYTLNRFKELCSQSKLIVLWSTPSNQSLIFTWPWEQDFHLNWKKHTFATTFENEIRPGLVYFSKRELKEMNLKGDALKNMLTDDPRPNHIGSVSVHNKIYETINKFITNSTTGVVNLDVS